MNIFEMLEIDKKASYVGKKIPKNMFYTQGNITKEEEKIFVEYIEKIELRYILDSRNINIDTFVNKEYNYSTIGYMYIVLKKDGKNDKIAKIIQSNIPSPLIIIFEYDNKICISTTLKRINQSDSTKVVVNDINTTPWILLNNINRSTDAFMKSISISGLDHTNLYKFYKQLDDKIYTFKNIEIVGEYKEVDNKGVEDTKEIIKQINLYEEEINKIIKNIEKESQFNKKLELNIKAMEIENKKNKLKELINNNR